MSLKVQRVCRRRTFGKSEQSESRERARVTPGPFAFRILAFMALLPLLLLLSQAAPAPAPPAAPTLSYRGFTPGMGYREFATRARAMARPKEVLGCQTMKSTAQVMDCGVRVRDPADSAPFYLSANVIEGRTSVISFIDSGKVSLLKQRQTELRSQLGTPTRRERSMWEWTNGPRFVRLNWRGGKDWRVVSITLNDRDVMNKIASYVPKKPVKR